MGRKSLKELLIQSNPEKYPVEDLLKDATDIWTKSYFEEEQFGSEFPWTKERAEEFSRIPIQTILDDKYFLNMKDILYPGWKDIIYELWEEREKRPINSVCIIGSIGAGKTLFSSVLMYLIFYYDLVCKFNPQRFYKLDPKSIIAIICMSVTTPQARKITFGKVYDRFQSEFNKEYFPIDPRLKRELRVPRLGVSIFPGTSSETSALGYDTYSSVIDECNFLEVVEDSKRAGVLDVYDAAEEMYNAVWTRMTSRFMKAGKVPGFIAMVSSPRYPDDFLERKIKEAEEQGKLSNIFWKRVKLWDMKPNIWQGERIWSGDKFRFDIDEMRILDDNEVIGTTIDGEDHNVTEVPIELRNEFERDPERSLRDLDARPMLALAPYFRNKAKIVDAFKKDFKNPFNEKTLSFDNDFECDDDYNRYIHIDLALKKDAVGIACCHVPHFVKVEKTNVVSGEMTKEIVDSPFIKVDLIGRITSQAGEEILFSDIQDIIYTLTDLGFYINLLTFDSFQSAQISQILRDEGYVVAQLSIDRTTYKIIVDHSSATDKRKRELFRKESTGRQYTAAMQALKDAIYEDRIEIPHHDHLSHELFQLESVRKGNIDLVMKPPNGTDDVSQSLAGAVFNACNNELPFYEEEPKKRGNELYDDKYYDELEEDLIRDNFGNEDRYGDDFYTKHEIE